MAPHLECFCGNFAWSCNICGAPICADCHKVLPRPDMINDLSVCKFCYGKYSKADKITILAQDPDDWY